MKKNFLSLIIILLFLFIFNIPLISAAPGAVDTIYLDPASSSPIVNQEFTVVVGANAGSTNHINIVTANLTFPSLTLVSCTPATGYEGAMGENPCATVSATEEHISVQTTQEKGAVNAVPVATLVFKSTTTGAKTITFQSHSVVVQRDSDNQSVVYTVITPVNGTYQVGTDGGVPTVTPTVTPPITLTPTPPGATNTLPPGCSIKPISEGNADGNCVIDEEDYHHWLGEFINPSQQLLELTADFNDDKKVDLVDYEIWRRNKI